MAVEKKQVRKEEWRRTLMGMEEEEGMKWADGTNCPSCKKTKTKMLLLRHSGVSDFPSEEFSSVTSPLNFPPDV